MENVEKRWCVVGGLDKGGILVRSGTDLSSAQLPDRLATGALVREVDLVGDRLCFQKLTGKGPETGWVSVRLKNKTLVEHAPYFEPKATLLGRQNGALVDLAPPAPKSRKIRVMCLHGTASSANVTKHQLAVLLKKTADDVEFCFPEGALECSEDHPIVGPQVKIMKKYFPREAFKQWVIPQKHQLGWREYQGLDSALDRIQTALKENEPVDAVLGFSQGSNLTHIVAAQAARGRGMPLRCVVHLCTSKPGWVEQLPDLFEWKLPVPALIVTAEKDTISLGCDEVAKSYETAIRASHAAEHRPLPPEIDQAEELAGVIKGFFLRYCR